MQIFDPKTQRQLARSGQWQGTTAGHCPAFQQANLVILPASLASSFAAFCTRNPKPCPLIEIIPPGDPAPVTAASGSDIRTDVAGYRVYRLGEQTDRLSSLESIWRNDLVSFLLGCSFTFDSALREAGIHLQHIEQGTTVPMYVSNLKCVDAGSFSGPMVVSLRAVPLSQLDLVLELSARYPHAHGVPVHVGDPTAIGIKDLDSPDFGDPIAMDGADVVPVFWACGVTPQAVARVSKPEIMVTHEPGQMYVTDLPRETAPGHHGIQ